MLRKLEKNQEKRMETERGTGRMIEKNSEGPEQEPTSTLGYLPLTMRRETFSAVAEHAGDRDEGLDCIWGIKTARKIILKL